MTGRWPAWPFAVGAALLSLAALRRAGPGRRWSYGEKTPGVASESAGGGQLDRDPSKLAPAFADNLEKLFQRLRAQGFDPMLNEGYRSPERGDRLKSLGYSQAGARSMHVWGAAADLISASGGWSDSEAMWQAMGPIAEDLGMIWGGRWSFYDPAHVQGVEVNEQKRLRGLPIDDGHEFVAGSLARRTKGVILV